MKNNLYVLTVALFFLITGCGKSGQESTPSPVVPTSVSGTATKTVDTAATGSLKGRVTIQSEVPPPREIPIRGNPECAVFHKDGKVLSEELIASNGALQNVFVYIKEGLEDYRFEPPAQPVTISNKQCVYAPHVVGVQAGQPVVLLNEDPTLHNIHSYSKNSKPWNLGLPFQGMKQTKKFDAPEVMVTLKCDVHPWMIGYVGVLPHPCFAVTDADGSFEIKNVPPGKYLIEAWQEKLGVQSQTIEIGPQETKEIEFKF